VGFGNAFETLKDADFFEYELILNQEVQKHCRVSGSAGRDHENLSFLPPPISPFGDLRNQVALFTQIRLNETLGLIVSMGFRKTADRDG